MTITEFLLARIAEDEAVAERWPPDSPPPDGFPYWMDAYGHPIWQPRKWVLAECEAKRAIIDLHHDIGGPGPALSDGSEYHSCAEDGDGVYDTWPCDTLKHLAAVYADRPDYQPEWRP